MSYGPDKNLTIKCDHDLGLPEQMFQMTHLHMMKNNCVKLFQNPSTIVEVLVRTNLDAHTDVHTPNCHRDNYVSLTARGLNIKYYSLNKFQIF